MTERLTHDIARDLRSYSQDADYSLDKALLREAADRLDGLANAENARDRARTVADERGEELRHLRDQLARVDPAKVAAWIAERDELAGQVATAEAENDRLRAELEAQKAYADLRVGRVVDQFDRYARAAVAVADEEDHTDWQRGYRAASDRLNIAMNRLVADLMPKPDALAADAPVAIERDLRRALDDEKRCGEVGPSGWICTRKPHTDMPHVQHLGGGCDAWMPVDDASAAPILAAEARATVALDHDPRAETFTVDTPAANERDEALREQLREDAEVHAAEIAASEPDDDEEEVDLRDDFWRRHVYDDFGFCVVEGCRSERDHNIDYHRDPKPNTLDPSVSATGDQITIHGDDRDLCELDLANALAPQAYCARRGCKQGDR